MSRKVAPLLVFGWGNPSRGDDALGPLLVEQLADRAQAQLPAGRLECLTDFQLQVEHALDLVGRERVLFVDAAIGLQTPFAVSKVHPAAVAGFTTGDLAIELVESQLTVRGKQSEDADRIYLHRGIAARQFQRAFMLADGIEVTGARLDNGLLSIDLARPTAEPRIRTIRIDAGKTDTGATNAVDITARRTQTR